MCHLPLWDASFYVLLWWIDTDLAATSRARGCRACEGGRLHVANYERKPRCGPGTPPSGFELRLSFCCGREGCRRRSTPPSVRFLGRRVYLGAVVVLVGALRSGSTPKRAAELQKLFGVSPRTLERWRRWWRETVPSSRFWSSLRGRLASPVDNDTLPASLLARLGGAVTLGVVALMRLLEPISTAPWLETVAW